MLTSIKSTQTNARLTRLFVHQPTIEGPRRCRTLRSRFAAMLLIVGVCLFYRPTVLYAQDQVIAATVISRAESIINELKNIGATYGGDFSIASGGTASQISAILNQFKAIVGSNVTVPLNSLGLDAQNLGRQLQSATQQINLILTNQRNCGIADASTVISGIRNIGLNVEKNIPLVSSGSPRVDYFQFAGHDPEVVPLTGGLATVFGYQLFSGSAPTVVLWDDSGHVVSSLIPQRATSDDSFSVPIAQSIITTYAGRTLLIDIHTHKKKHIWGIFPDGEDSAELKLPLTVPREYNLQYRVSAKASYSCTVPKAGELPPVTIGLENSSCEDRKNYSEVRTPALPSGPGISNVRITGYHFVNGPNLRNQSSIAVSTTATTITAAGWLDTATCVQIGFPIHIAHLDHPTNWSATIVPEIQFDQSMEHDEIAKPTLVPAILPVTTATLQVNSSCFEPGAKSFSYTVTPEINGMDQSDLYDSPIATGSEHGVSQSATLNSVSLTGTWNPQPVSGTSQIAITIAAPQCGK